MKRDNTALLAQLKAIRADIDAALATIATKHGITINTGKATYDPGALNFTFKVEGQFPGGISKEGHLYEMLRSYTPELPPLGTVLRYKDKVMTITGCNTTATKIHATHQDGKTYLWAKDAIVKIAAMPQNSASPEKVTA